MIRRLGHRPAAAALLMAWLTSMCSAQTVVLPSALTTAPPPPGADFPNVLTFVGPPAFRCQWAYDTNDVAPAAAAWVSMQFRRAAAEAAAPGRPAGKMRAHGYTERLRNGK